MTKRQLDKFRAELEKKLSEIEKNSALRSELITERSNDPMDQMQSRQDLDLTIHTIDSASRLLDDNVLAAGIHRSIVVEPSELKRAGFDRPGVEGYVGICRLSWEHVGTENFNTVICDKQRVDNVAGL